MKVSQVHRGATIGEYAANQAAIRHFSKFFANNRGPDIRIVPPTIVHFLHRKQKTTHYVRVVLGGVAMRRRIQKLNTKNSAEGLMAIYTKF